jgi:hypothetical protein
MWGMFKDGVHLAMNDASLAKVDVLVSWTAITIGMKKLFVRVAVQYLIAGSQLTNFLLTTCFVLRFLDSSRLWIPTVDMPMYM